MAALVGCAAESGTDVNESSDALGSADGGATIVVDGAVVLAPAPVPAPVRAMVEAAVVPLRARAARVKPAAITCADVSGPNMVRFKLREGVAAHFDERTRTIVPDTGVRLSAAASSDLARATSLGDYFASAFGRPATEMRDLKARAEAESGDEAPDLSLWFDLGVGGHGVQNVATADRALCDRVANVVNELNALDTVEVAFARSAPTVASVPFLGQASDISPTTLSFEPPHMGAVSAGGMNSPEFPVHMPTSWTSAFRGSSVAIVDIEWDFTAHEKFNATRLRNASNNEGLVTGQNTGHGNASMGAAFGTARSAGSSGNPRYGTRGFAPQAGRGFSGIVDWDFFLGNNEDTAEAVADAGAIADSGDILFIEVQTGCFDGDNVCDPIDTRADVADCINLYTDLGRIYLVPMGNGFQNGAGNGTDRGATRPSKAIYVAANNADGLTRRFFSNFGSLVDVNAWGMNVWSPAGMDGTAGSCWLPSVGGGCGTPPTSNAQAYISNYGGTSSATAVTAGALGQIESLYEALYGRRMGFTANRNAAVLRDTVRAGATLVPPVGMNVFGLQPNVYHTAMHVVPATRFGLPLYATGLGNLLPPHNEMLTSSYAAGSARTSSLFGGIRSTTPNAGVTLTERVAGMTTRGPLDLGQADEDFSIAFRAFQINGPTSQFQIIAAKENPRNYSVTLYPTAFGVNAGKIEFSYQPSGTSAFCPVSSGSAITDGGVHSVVIVFDRIPFGTTQILFYVDGVFDVQRSGCGLVGPGTNNGFDQSVATLAANLEANSTIGDIRLYRRKLVLSEITGYHNGTN